MPIDKYKASEVAEIIEEKDGNVYDFYSQAIDHNFSQCTCCGAYVQRDIDMAGEIIIKNVRYDEICQDCIDKIQDGVDYGQIHYDEDYDDYDPLEEEEEEITTKGR